MVEPPRDGSFRSADGSFKSNGSAEQSVLTASRRDGSFRSADASFHSANSSASEHEQFVATHCEMLGKLTSSSPGALPQIKAGAGTLNRLHTPAARSKLLGSFSIGTKDTKYQSAVEGAPSSTGSFRRPNTSGALLPVRTSAKVTPLAVPGYPRIEDIVASRQPPMPPKVDAPTIAGPTTVASIMGPPTPAPPSEPPPRPGLLERLTRRTSTSTSTSGQAAGPPAPLQPSTEADATVDDATVDKDGMVTVSTHEGLCEADQTANVARAAGTTRRRSSTVTSMLANLMWPDPPSRRSSTVDDLRDEGGSTNGSDGINMGRRHSSILGGIRDIFSIRGGGHHHNENCTSAAVPSLSQDGDAGTDTLSARAAVIVAGEGGPATRAGAAGERVGTRGRRSSFKLDDKQRRGRRRSSTAAAVQFYSVGLKNALGELRKLIKPSHAVRGRGVGRRKAEERTERTISMLALAAGVQARRNNDGLNRAGTLKDLTLPKDVDEQPTGMLHHQPGEHTRLRRRSFLIEAQNEHTRRRSASNMASDAAVHAAVAHSAAQWDAAHGSAPFHGSVRRSSTDKLERVRRLSDSSAKSMTSSIFAEAAATALLMQQRSLEAAMLEGYLTLHNKPPMVVGVTPMITTPTATAMGSETGPVGNEMEGADTPDSSLVAQASLARHALEASMNLRSTLNQQADR